VHACARRKKKRDSSVRKGWPSHVADFFFGKKDVAEFIGRWAKQVNYI
jgi:hypothetical protein